MTILIVLQRVDCNDGVAAYLESLITGLRDNGHTVILVSGPVTTLYGSEARRLRIEAATADWIVVRPGPATLRRLVAIVASHDVDVLNPQGFSALPAARIAGWLTRRPVVLNFRLLGERLHARQRLLYRTVAALFAADRYIAMSDDIGRFFRQVCAIPQRLIRTQYLGVDTDHFRRPDEPERARARAAFGLADTQFTALLPGRLNRSKGHDVATAAFRLLRSRAAPIEAVCLFAGAGDQRAAIEADSWRDDADRAAFRFLGFVDRERMRQAYWAADVVLLPSRLEGFPLVVIEAMACGAIVIRTPGSGWRTQIVVGETGYVVAFDDPEALAGAIETVASHRAPAAIRQAAARLATTRFSRAAMVAGTEAILRETCDPRPRRV